MEISKGMYIRTEDGYISKCIDIDSDNFAFFDKPVYKNFSDTFDSCYLSNIDIKKASFDIIDLIEVGDYVNGTFVLDFKTLATGEKAVIVNGFINYGWGQGVTPVSDIKDIVTNEQFNSMKYMIERDK